jgi:hypothetical protein
MLSIPVALIAVLAGSAAAPQAANDRCIQGYVWREAVAGDHVCVTPEVREQAAMDNRLAPRRRQPGGGAYGPDTCRSGFVWREATPSDRVCVTIETRRQTERDNAAAASRVMRPNPVVRPGVQVRPDTRVIRTPGQIQQPPGFPGTPPPSTGTQVKRGFDDDGQPYIDETLPDGSIRRQQDKGVTVIKPDGTQTFYPNMVVRSNAPVPTPPDLPDDPALGRGWVTYHNDQLLALISALVDNDESEMLKFHAAEQQAVGTDLFKQVEFRTRILQTLARP